MRRLLTTSLAIAFLTGCGNNTNTHPFEACLTGAYQSEDGKAVVTGLTSGGLRLGLLNGTVFNLAPMDDDRFLMLPGLSPGGAPVGTLTPITDDCANAELQNSRAPEKRFTKLPLQIVETDFANGPVQLHGKFVVPSTSPPHDYVVLVHGSGDISATQYMYFQYLYPAQNIAAFVFDKRGTGDSTGEFSANFEVLASDVVSALNHVRTEAPTEINKLGLSGFSQGGWVAPLAAQLDGNIDFLQVSYGLVDSPFSEDREEAFRDLRLAGFDESDMEEAWPLIDAVHAVILSGFREGLDDLARIKKETADTPWRDIMYGEFTGEVLRWPVWLLPVVSLFFSDAGLIFDYDTTPVLEAIDVPFLWMVAGADREAPPQNTLTFLNALKDHNANLDVTVFPDTDHGMVLFTEENNVRSFTGYAPGYFALLAEWIYALE